MGINGYPANLRSLQVRRREDLTDCVVRAADYFSRGAPTERYRDMRNSAGLRVRGRVRPLAGDARFVTEFGAS